MPRTRVRALALVLMAACGADSGPSPPDGGTTVAFRGADVSALERIEQG